MQVPLSSVLSERSGAGDWRWIITGSNGKQLAFLIPLWMNGQPTLFRVVKTRMAGLGSAAAAAKKH
jgi:hypothetical protein